MQTHIYACVYNYSHIIFSFTHISTHPRFTTDSEDERRVVRSQKDKAWESMLDAIKKISNAKKNSDWNVIQDEFEKTNKMIEKSRMLILKSGLPKFYIKMLAEVEDFVSESIKDKDALKALKPAQKKALDRMKLTVKKHNKTYEAEIADFRQNPDKYEEAEEEEESGSSDESESDDDDSESDDEKSESSESESESSDEDLMAKPKAKPVKAKVRINLYIFFFLMLVCLFACLPHGPPQ